MRAIGYFSEPDRQKGQPGALSLSAQNDGFLAHCDANGYEPSAAFLDADLSAARPGFQQLLQYLDEPEKGFVTVVIQAFAHLGDDRVRAARSYFQITARAAQIVSLGEGPLDDANVVGLWSAQRAQSEPGDKVRDAMRKRAVQGKVLGRPPYGYCVGADRRLEVVEHEAEVVRHIFSLSLEGLGIRRIAKRLNEEGYRTRRDGRWSMVTIRDLLRNRVYLGTYSRFGVRVPGNHPALVRETDFRAVQEATERRRTNNLAKERSSGADSSSDERGPSQFLLSGLVYCADTDSKMIGVTRRQRWTRRDGEEARNTYRYYQSEARTNQSVGEYATRRADDLEAEVIRHLTGEAEGAVRSAVLAAGDASAVAAELSAAERRIQTRMRSAEKRLHSQLDRAAEGRLGQDGLREAALEVVLDYQSAEEELAGLRRRREAQTSEQERQRYQEQQLGRIRQNWGILPFGDRRALLRDVVEQVVVEGGSVRTVLRV